MKHILFCSECKKYTMQTLCTCGKKTVSQKPQRYSPTDKFGEYRRKAKKIMAKKETE